MRVWPARSFTKVAGMLCAAGMSNDSGDKRCCLHFMKPFVQTPIDVHVCVCVHVECIYLQVRCSTFSSLQVNQSLPHSPCVSHWCTRHLLASMWDGEDSLNHSDINWFLLILDALDVWCQYIVRNTRAVGGRSGGPTNIRTLSRIDSTMNVTATASVRCWTSRHCKHWPSPCTLYDTFQ